jgi:hypothetical protein
VGGLPVSELNALELEFLRLNNYSLFVTIEELQKYGDNILFHYNNSQQLLVVKDITNNNNNNEEIARPFSRLTMKSKIVPTSSSNELDSKQWRYSTSGNNNKFSSLSLTSESDTGRMQ